MFETAKSWSASKVSAIENAVRTFGDLRNLLLIKKVTFQKNAQDKVADIQEIVVFDDTFEAVLSLWEDMIDSATVWKPSSTILLITNPGWKEAKKGNGKLYINPNTYTDVDPDMYDASWLRNHALRMARKEHVNPPFPYDSKNAPGTRSSSMTSTF